MPAQPNEAVQDGTRVEIPLPEVSTADEDEEEPSTGSGADHTPSETSNTVEDRHVP